MLGDMTSSGLPALGVRDLRWKVATHLRELASEALDNDNINLGLAARIADSLWSLIDATEGGSVENRTAVRGAVDYFVLNRDEISDLDDPNGFVDDAEVVNQVCVQLGLPEVQVRIPGEQPPALPS